MDSNIKIGFFDHKYPQTRNIVLPIPIRAAKVCKTLYENLVILYGINRGRKVNAKRKLFHA